eukprot:scaffold669_cov152-Isochrysis_galbana.AAC.3
MVVVVVVGHCEIPLDLAMTDCDHYAYQKRCIRTPAHVQHMAGTVRMLALDRDHRGLGPQVESGLAGQGVIDSVDG